MAIAGQTECPPSFLTTYTWSACSIAQPALCAQTARVDSEHFPQGQMDHSEWVNGQIPPNPDPLPEIAHSAAVRYTGRGSKGSANIDQPATP